MRSKLILSVLLAMGVSAASVHAWCVSGVVACPNGRSACGIVLIVKGVGFTTTDSQGVYSMELPNCANTYKICVDSAPPGFIVSGNNCQTFRVDDNTPYAYNVNFTLTGPECSCAPPPGLCWLTGGGQIGKSQGAGNYSFGGVVNPGCSPIAAGGGNWNVIDHNLGIHFKGLFITVDSCSGRPTSSPAVNVNIIDFHGVGYVEGVGGTPLPKTAVNFVGRAIDNAESGGGADQLYLHAFVTDSNGTTTYMLIEDPANAGSPATLSIGNLQIHTTGCSN